MTRELLAEANRLNHAISDLENQIAIAEDMHHCDSALTLKVESIGSITIAWDDELKDDIIDIVLRRLNTTKDDMEDKLRRL
jgi:hypothetical protein